MACSALFVSVDNPSRATALPTLHQEGAGVTVQWFTSPSPALRRVGLVAHERRSGVAKGNMGRVWLKEQALVACESELPRILFLVPLPFTHPLDHNLKP